MTKPARRTQILMCAAVLTVALPCAAFATARPYLSWQNKTELQTSAPPVETHTSSGTYDVPASPYGQVGDPYARTLRWPTKPAMAVASVSPPPRAPLPQPVYAAMPAAPIRQAAPVSVSTPVPLSVPRPVAVVPVPEPVDPGLADDPGMAADAPITAPVAAPVRSTPVKVQARPAPAVASTPAPVSAPADDGAYQVPATSVYAARINAARAAQAKAEAQATQTATKSTATAPTAGASLASQETDHVFIPGEHYTSAVDEPRVYSLHRQYGMHPDPITVTPDAGGALLTVEPDADSSKDDDSKSDTADTKSADKN